MVNKKVKEGSAASLVGFIVLLGVFYLVVRTIWIAVSDVDWEASI